MAKVRAGRLPWAKGCSPPRVRRSLSWTLADDLAGLDKIRQENASDADFQSRSARLAPLLADLPRAVVLEASAGAGDAHRDVHQSTGLVRAVRWGCAGRAPEARGVREGSPGQRNDHCSLAAGLQLRGISFTALGRYADLAELDKHVRAVGRRWSI